MRWTDFEDDVLGALRPTCSTSEIVAAMSALGFSRSVESVDCRSRRVGVRHKKPGPLNVESLRSKFGKGPATKIVSAVNTQRSSVPIEGAAKTLAAIYPVMSLDEVLSVFERAYPSVTKTQVQKHAATNGLAYEGLGYPNTGELPKGARRAVRQVMEERSKRLASVEGGAPHEYRSSDRTRRTKLLKDVKAEMIDRLNYLRSTLRTTAATTGGVAVDSDKRTLVLNLSDLHVGRLVFDESRRQIFNIAIANERIKSVPDRVRRALESNGSLDLYDECVVLINGDLVDGEGIFPGQAFMLETFVVEQVDNVVNSLWSALLGLHELFGNVRCYTTRGNHGRSGKTHGQSPESNWDNVVYLQLACMAQLTATQRGDNTLSVTNQYGEYSQCLVKGWRGMVRHKGPPHAGTRSAQAKWAGWKIIHGFDFICSGHFHHPGWETYNNTHIFRNGSLPGGDEYSESLGLTDRPAQLAFGVSKKKLPTNIFPIYFDE